MDKKQVASELLRCARLVMGMEFDTKEELEKYLKDHPDADRSLHTVKKQETVQVGGREWNEEKTDKVSGHIDNLLGMHKKLFLTKDDRDPNRKDVKKERRQAFREMGKKLDDVVRDSGNNPKFKASVRTIKDLLKEGQDKGFSMDDINNVSAHIHAMKVHMKGDQEKQW